MKIEVQVTNRRAYLLGSPPMRELAPYWQYFHPDYGYMRKAKPFMTWDGLIKLYDPVEKSLPAGLFWGTRKQITEETGHTFHVTGTLLQPELNGRNGLSSDRDYQNDCVNKMMKVIRYGGGLVLSATGSGKTWITAMFFSRLKGRCAFVVDQLVLLEQARAELEQVLGEEVGIIGKSIFDPKRVTVCTIQSMYLHRNRNDYRQWAKDVDVSIVDEIHEQMNKRNFVVVSKMEPKACYGLTATLQMGRKDVRIRALALAGPVIFEFPLQQGQKEGVLAQGVAMNVLFENKMTELEQESEGAVKAYTDRIVVNDDRNRLLVRFVREARNRNYYTLLLVRRVRHLKILSDMLDDVPHRIVSGTFGGKIVDITKRMEAKKKFEEGKVRVILANDVFKKGIDMRRVDVIIDGAAGSSKDDVIQKYGRGVRTDDEKSGLMYFDISDVDPDNGKNFFWKGAKQRMSALNKAGIMRKQMASWDASVREIFEDTEKLLKKVLERTSQLRLEGM